MSRITRRGLLASAFLLPAAALIGCNNDGDGPVAPPPPAPGTVKMPSGGPGVLPEGMRPPERKRGGGPPNSGAAPS